MLPKEIWDIVYGLIHLSMIAAVHVEYRSIVEYDDVMRLLCVGSGCMNDRIYQDGYWDYPVITHIYIKSRLYKVVTGHALPKNY